MSDFHDAGVLRGIVCDFCGWAYGEGSLHAGMPGPQDATNIRAKETGKPPD